MNNKRIILILLVLILTLVSLSGCKGLDDLRIRRGVENNVLTSSFPEINLKINQEFTYLGEVTLDEASQPPLSVKDFHDSSIKNNSYLFGQFNQGGKLSKGVLVRMTVHMGDPSQQGQNTTGEDRNVLDSGIERILEQDYQSLFYTQHDIFTKQEKGLLPQGSSAVCYLVKLLQKKAGLGNKSRVEIIYFEDIAAECGDSSCEGCLKAGMLTQTQIQHMREFSDRSYSGIRFIEPLKTINATSKYVDYDKNPQPQGNINQNIDTLKTGTIEQRLKALKDLYDKNLITKEDFEKKKAEILKQL
jgi:hypothetical protein